MTAGNDRLPPKEADLFRASAAEFSSRLVEPQAASIDDSGQFPEELVARMGEHGLLGITLPTDEGGAGGDLYCLVTSVMEISKASATMGLMVAVHNASSLVLSMARSRSTPVPLEELARGRKMATLGLLNSRGRLTVTPDQVQVKEEGGTLSGRCYFAPYPKRSAYLVTTAARADGEIFVASVSSGSKDVSIDRPLGTMGLHGLETSHVGLDSCSPAGVLGDLPPDLVASIFEIGVSAVELGVSFRAIADARSYASQRVQFGEPIGTFVAIKDVLGEAEARYAGALSALTRAASLPTPQLKNIKHSIAARLLASSSCLLSARTCLRIHGGYGFVKGFSAERLVRDAKTISILGGAPIYLKRILGAG